MRNIAADVGNGKFKGDLTLSDTAGSVSAKGRVALAGADAAALIRSGARPPLAGELGLDLSFEGSGLSPVALIGSLHGSGKLTLKDAQVAGVDPRAFDAVARAVDDGLQVEPARISDLIGRALDSGTLKLRRVEADLAIATGQLRLMRVNAESDDAALSANGSMLDLTDGMIDAHVVLSGSAAGASARPDIFMSLNGPLAEPQKSIDVSALTGWLTLRAAENQAKKLKALEEAEAKRRAEEAKRVAEEDARRRAVEEEKRRIEETRRREAEARARAEDEAKLRALSDAPPVVPVLAPAPLTNAAPSKPEPKNAVSSSDLQPPKPAQETPTASAPARPPAPALPPPVTIKRAPAPVWGRDIH
jgi:large subunit ribosomal protein L24